MKKTITIGIIIGIIGIFGYINITHKTSDQTQYQTATAQKGTLVVSVSVSGQVSSANSAEVTTQASGVVKTVFVKDGDSVKAGEKIAQLDLDLTGQQRSQQAYATYQGAKNSLDTARATAYTAQSTLLTQWESYMAKAQNSTYQNSDNTPNTSNRQVTDFVVTQNDWLAAEAKYKIQQNTIIQAQTSASSSWYAYQQTSPTIVAPINGIITGLSLQPGTVITAQTNSSGGSSSQRIASVKTNAPATVSLNLTQIDAPKITMGNKAIVTFDAFPEKTFTGTVISLDTIGQTSSGVTTYTAIVKLDTDVDGLLPNMSASATIITKTKTDVIMVPLSAVSTENGQTSVRIMKNNSPQTTAVQTGISSDTETEIISGIQEGDVVVTSIITPSTSATTQTGSPFSTFGGTRSGGNTQFRVIR